MAAFRNFLFIYSQKDIRGYLKNIFWPNLCVGRSYQILEILEYSSGLIFAAALTLDQNLIFKIPMKKLPSTTKCL